MDIQKPLISSPQILRNLQFIILGGVILYFGRNVFIPVSYALFISFVLYPVCAWMEKRGAGRLTAIIIAITLLLLFGLMLVSLLMQQVLSFVGELPSLRSKLFDGIEQLSQFVSDAFGISKEKQNVWIDRISGQSGFNVVQFLRTMISASAYTAVMLVLVPVYAVLILYHRSQWLKIVFQIFPSEGSDKLREIIMLTVKAYYSFIKGMGAVYLIVGILNSIGLLLLGVPHAILFGFIASVLTFIPYIGITVGSLLPITIAWITYDSIWYPIGIICIFVFVQYLEANVIFPMAVSRRLNVNTLVTLLAIFTGGILWGMSGMILFVPFVGIAKLIADYNPKWKTVSLILGKDQKH
ncbi:MAG: AI-2E family transporter [Cyclobacteriaceae bacterium]|nr:AI-2E family transporter [Cyclobacteriaceae bacterium]MDH4296416.1 AI-2E family transporter [Cyclobacteriaceae bacterium]MDH5248837.1 AI-2E family transporter [Cyclobacteriaceae bacterium]